MRGLISPLCQTIISSSFPGRSMARILVEKTNQPLPQVIDFGGVRPFGEAHPTSDWEGSKSRFQELRLLMQTFREAFACTSAPTRNAATKSRSARATHRPGRPVRPSDILVRWAGGQGGSVSLAVPDLVIKQFASFVDLPSSAT
jgi:hypothetical protein